MKTRLFTPGPLTTHPSTREAMSRDFGSRDNRFMTAVAEIRSELVRLAGRKDMEAVLMQGSGTFVIESAIDTLMGQGSEILVAINGAYGRRARDIARRLGLFVHVVEIPEDRAFDADTMARALDEAPGCRSVWMVHCETTTGILNPLGPVSEVVRQHGARLYVDGMSSFGGMPIDLESTGVSCLVSSANKCLEGVPGFGFMVVERTLLEASDGRARSTSLDAYAQWKAMEDTGQFRFTPPTHAMMAFRQALRLLDDEGGILARNARYAARHKELMTGMTAMGFRSYLDPAVQSVFISTFLYPEHEAWDFPALYERLADRGLVLYPGKLTTQPCFRIGNIGQLTSQDLVDLLTAIEEEVRAMGVPVPVTGP